MSYVWGAQGPAFEYPTCYRIENRFLALRAAALAALAMALLWIALSEPNVDTSAAVLRKVERGASWPHVLMALMWLVLALIDGIRASRQRTLRLGEGQPASLIREVAHGVHGASGGAAALLRQLESGVRVNLEAGDSVLPAGARPSAGASLTPRANFVRLRATHAVFAAGQLLVLGALWFAGSQSAGLPLAAFVAVLVTISWMGYSTWIASGPPGRGALASGWVCTVVVGAGVLVLGTRVPHVQLLGGLALPGAAMSLLAGLCLSEAMAALAGRAQDDLPEGKPAPMVPLVSPGPVDPALAMREVDAELVRRCIDGVPNRRYVRLPWVAGAASADDAALPTVLEESQPGLPRSHQERLPAPPFSRMAMVLVLCGTGLLLTVVGGLLWVRMAFALLQDASTPWSPAALGLSLLLLGGYLLRLGHFVWSRIEVESTIYAVEVKAERLSVRVWRARSVFFAAGDQRLGSRTLVKAVADPAAAQAFVRRVLEFSGRSPTVAASEAQPRLGRGSPVAASALQSSPVPPARFCPQCGTPLLQGARFCQQCGAGLPS